MDSDSEVRFAILALIQAHKRDLALLRALDRILRAAKGENPALGSLWRGVANAEQRELEIAVQEAADVEAALNNSQQFADLLQQYAGRG